MVFLRSLKCRQKIEHTQKQINDYQKKIGELDKAKKNLATKDERSRGVLQTPWAANLHGVNSFNVISFYQFEIAEKLLYFQSLWRALFPIQMILLAVILFYIFCKQSLNHSVYEAMQMRLLFVLFLSSFNSWQAYIRSLH